MKELFKRMYGTIKDIPLKTIRSIRLTWSIITFFAIAVTPYICTVMMYIMAVFFDYKPDIIYKFMPLGINLGSSMLSAGVIGAVLALAKSIVDVNHNGIPDDFEKDDNKKG